MNVTKSLHGELMNYTTDDVTNKLFLKMHINFRLTSLFISAKFSVHDTLA